MLAASIFKRDRLVPIMMPAPALDGSFSIALWVRNYRQGARLIGARDTV